MFGLNVTSKILCRMWSLLGLTCRQLLSTVQWLTTYNLTYICLLTFHSRVVTRDNSLSTRKMLWHFTWYIVVREILYKQMKRVPSLSSKRLSISMKKRYISISSIVFMFIKPTSILPISTVGTVRTGFWLGWVKCTVTGNLKAYWPPHLSSQM